MCSLGISGSLLSVGIYKLQTSHVIDTAQTAVNLANASVLNAAYQQATITGSFSPRGKDADSIIGEMMERGLVSRFEYRGGYYMDKGFFYANVGFRPGIPGLPALPVTVDPTPAVDATPKR